MRARMSILATLVLVPSLVQGEILEYPLPNFNGDTGAYLDSVVYAGDLVEVSSVTLRVDFTIDDLGGQLCVEFPPVPSYYCTLGVNLIGEVWRNDGRYDDFYAFHNEHTREGQFTEDLVMTPAPGFVELADGDIIQIELRFNKEGPCCADLPILLAEATLNSVTLVFDVSTLVPTKQTSWGRIKSLYD